MHVNIHSQKHRNSHIYKHKLHRLFAYALAYPCTCTHALAHVLTLIVQLGTILAEAFQPHSLAEEVQELLEGWPCCLVVVHFLFRALPSFAVQDPNFVLKAQLKWEETWWTWQTPDLLASSQVKAAEAWDLVPRKACWKKSQKQLSLCKMLQIGTKSRNPGIQLEKSERP